MYTVEGKVRTVTGTDGVRREEAAPTMQFSTAVAMFRWAVTSGEFPYHRLGHNGSRNIRIKDVHLGSPGCPMRVSRTFDTFRQYEWTDAHWTAMYNAQQRIRELWHYVSEVLPEWQTVEEVHYLDNSVVRYEANRYGNTRAVTLVHPHGDLC